MRTASTWPPWKPTSRRRRSVMCGLHDLGEHAAGGLGVHKCHAALLDPASRLLVDHPDPGLAHPLQRGVDVGGAVGHVELLTPIESDSALARFLAKNGPGMHHVAYRTADIDAALERMSQAGVRMIDEPARSGIQESRVAFVHPKS